MNTTAIAQHLNIAAEAIIKIEEWATVLWVRFKGGCRFVSKKIMSIIDAKHFTLPELTGSEKQIAWANDIRQLWIDSAIRYQAEQSEDYPCDPEKLTKLKTVIEAVKGAGFWIDTRQEIDWVKNPRFSDFGVFSGGLEIESIPNLYRAFKRYKKG